MKLIKHNHITITTDDNFRGGYKILFTINNFNHTNFGEWDKNKKYLITYYTLSLKQYLIINKIPFILKYIQGMLYISHYYIKKI